MPYDREILFNPSDKFKNAWSLAPQNQVLELDGHKTNSMYADLSAAIPIFYLLTFLAISFDIYLGFSVLAKAGVNLPVVVISVIADIFLAIIVYLFALRSKNYNHNYLNNELFKLQLERKTRKKNESIDDYRHRKSSITSQINVLKKKIKWVKFLKWFFSVVIFAIAGWKIYTYMGTLPPSLSIFSVVKGKIVIILALLTASFHVLATEKSAASLWFNHIKNKEIKKHLEETSINDSEIARHDAKHQPIDFVGKFRPSQSGNTKLIVDETGENASLEYIYLIWDDEIKYLMDNQSDEEAKKSVVIACKQTQLF